MRKFGRYIFLIIFTGILMPLMAQDEAVFDSLTIKGQFEYVIQKSNTYEQFKVVRYRHINLLKKAALDSVNNLKGQIGANMTEIAQLKSTQAELNANIEKLQTDLDAVTKSKNSMSFFGQEIPKGIYNTIMWSLVLVLAVLGLVLFTMFKRSHAVTRETKLRLGEVEEEFDKHRKSALKREQKLARELMDYKVKNKL